MSMTGTSAFDGLEPVAKNDAVTVDAIHGTGKEAREAFTALCDFLGELEGVTSSGIEYEVDEGVDRDGERVFRSDEEHPLSLNVNIDDRNVPSETLRVLIDVADEYELHLSSYDMEVREWLTQYTLGKHRR